MLEVRHVTKRYGRLTAVRDVSFTCPENRTVGLLGVNGAGKTTLLNMITGCMPPTEGTILVGGKDLERHPAPARRSMGYLPEKPPLYDEMTVASYLRFVSRLREVEARDVERHVRNIMELCAISDVAGRLLGHLSKGYRQRVGIAQALCGDPPFLVLDEPTVGLDPRQVVEMRGLIRRLGEDHTILLSSHTLPEVQQICDRIIIVHHGVILREENLEADGGSGQRTRVIAFSARGAEDRIRQALMDLSGLRKVNSLKADGEGYTEGEITVDSGGTPEENLFRLLAARDLPLRRLEPKRDSLESLFLRVTAEGGENA